MKLSNSKLSCFRDCPYRYWLEYEQYLEPLIKPWPLLDGSALHKALEAYYTPEAPKEALPTIDLALKCQKWGITEPNLPILAVVEKFYDDLAENTDEANMEAIQQHRATVMGMVAGYTILYKPDEFEICLPEKKEIIDVEGMYLPVTTTKGEDTEHKHGLLEIPPKAPNIQLVVKADRIVRKNDVWWLHETKTTSIVKKERMMEMLMRDWQSKTYTWAYKQKEYPVAGVIFDVINKAKLRKTKFETFENFYGRIVKDYIKDAQAGFVDGGTATQKYYYREATSPSPSDLIRFEKTLKMVAADLAYAQTCQLWYENDKRCMDYKEPCPFLRICQEPEEAARLEIMGAYFRKKERR